MVGLLCVRALVLRACGTTLHDPVASGDVRQQRTGAVDGGVGPDPSAPGGTAPVDGGIGVGDAAGTGTGATAPGSASGSTSSGTAGSGGGATSSTTRSGTAQTGPVTLGFLTTGTGNAGALGISAGRSWTAELEIPGTATAGPVDLNISCLGEDPAFEGPGPYFDYPRAGDFAVPGASTTVESQVVV